MGLDERDPVSGYKTTGHDWNGIKELNSPVPRAVIAFLVVTHLYALIAWILLPTWPIPFGGVTKGLWGVDQKTDVARQLDRIENGRAVWQRQVTEKPLDAVKADPALMARVTAAGKALFGQNCQPCHGVEGRGQPGFPRLNDAIWLWDGTPDGIARTIRVGINAAHADTRTTQMPPFGASLSREERGLLADFVQAISTGTAADPAGAKLFADNCVACHGETAKGNKEMGVPDLTDADWLYGGDRDTILTTLHGGRQGQMPAWAGRLSETDIRILALYVSGLSGAGK